MGEGARPGVLQKYRNIDIPCHLQATTPPAPSTQTKGGGEDTTQYRGRSPVTVRLSTKSTIPTNGTTATHAPDPARSTRHKAADRGIHQFWITFDELRPWCTRPPFQPSNLASACYHGQVLLNRDTRNHAPHHRDPFRETQSYPLRRTTFCVTQGHIRPRAR